MPNNATAKTGSGHKFKFRSKLLLLAVLLFVFFVAITVVIKDSKMATDNIFVSGRKYTLLVAKTSQQQSKGLGGRNSLPVNEGMLFPFSQSDMLCFWMKDMRFPLDIIWLSSNKQVQYIQADALPSSYPNNFCPYVESKYVIELNAGQVIKANIQVGEKLEF